MTGFARAVAPARPYALLTASPSDAMSHMRSDQPTASAQASATMLVSFGTDNQWLVAAVAPPIRYPAIE